LHPSEQQRIVAKIEELFSDWTLALRRSSVCRSR
jgi:hypothetical protein